MKRKIVATAVKPGSIYSKFEKDLDHAKGLLSAASDTGDGDYAWDLVDFLGDSMLLDKSQVDSSIVEDLRHADVLLKHASYTQDIDYAWDLVDHLYDSNLLDHLKSRED